MGRVKAAWNTLLDDVADEGKDAGRCAAEWQLQDTLGGRASGDTTETARRILAGMEDGDPVVMDALPSPDLSGADGGPTLRGLYEDNAPDGLPGFDELTSDQQGEIEDAYEHAFNDAVSEETERGAREAAQS